MSDLALIREALRDPTIAAYPDFIKAVGDVCDQLERFRSEREYIIGCNDGFDSAIGQAAIVAGDYAGKQSPIAAAIRALATPSKPKGGPNNAD